MKTLGAIFFVLLPPLAPVAWAEETARPNSGKPAEAPPAVVFDINQASAEDFAKLPGIGPELARRIVAYREKHGPFRRVEDLMAIRGIGTRKWRALRPYIRVVSRPDPSAQDRPK